MSALSVMSMIAPTAPVGASAASVETAADDGLFAGLVAAVAPSLKAQGEDSRDQTGEQAVVRRIRGNGGGCADRGGRGDHGHDAERGHERR